MLYINAIVNTTSLLELTWTLFADDITLLFSHPDISSQNNIINNELQELYNWFQDSRLSVNTSKTNYMVLFWKFINTNQETYLPNDSEPTSSRNA